MTRARHDQLLLDQVAASVLGALFAAIVALGWHPLMRVKKGGCFRPSGWSCSYPMQQLAGRKAESLNAEGRVYSDQKMRCTLLTRWEEGYTEPWLVLTDLPPEAASAVRTIRRRFERAKGPTRARRVTNHAGPPGSPSAGGADSVDAIASNQSG